MSDNLYVNRLIYTTTVHFPVLGTSRSVPGLNVCCLIRDIETWGAAMQSSCHLRFTGVVKREAAVIVLYAGLPKASPACQVGLPGRTFSLAWQAGPWPDRPAGRDPPTYYNKLLIHFAMSIAIAVVGTLWVHLDYKLRWRKLRGSWWTAQIWIRIHSHS